MASPSASYQGGLNTIRRVIVLGTGAVTSANHSIGAMPKRGRVVRIRYFGRGVVTGTSLTAHVFARNMPASSRTAQQASATDIKFLSSTAALNGIEASLTTNQAARDIVDGRLFEVDIQANAITAGTGDLVVEIDFEPR